LESPCLLGTLNSFSKQAEARRNLNKPHWDAAVWKLLCVTPHGRLSPTFQDERPLAKGSAFLLFQGPLLFSGRRTNSGERMIPYRIVAVAVAAMLSGCVSVTDPNNYRPQSGTLSQDFYQCETGSTATGASATWNQYGGSANVGARTNSELLLRCMEAREYRLRKATTGEWVAGIAFLPVTIPLTAIGALGGGYIWSDDRMGGGSAEP
jgi:hypothetical protein